jgi:tRNA-dihydrouridine synthase 3
VTLHGRSRQQRYTKLADWGYIAHCAHASALPLIGNGDGFSYEDLDTALKAETGISSLMLARGALVKPWVFTEMKVRQHHSI